MGFWGFGVLGTNATFPIRPLAPPIAKAVCGSAPIFIWVRMLTVIKRTKLHAIRCPGTKHHCSLFALNNLFYFVFMIFFLSFFVLLFRHLFINKKIASCSNVCDDRVFAADVVTNCSVTRARARLAVPHHSSRTAQ